MLGLLVYRGMEVSRSDHPPCRIHMVHQGRTRGREHEDLGCAAPACWGSLPLRAQQRLGHCRCQAGCPSRSAAARAAAAAARPGTAGRCRRWRPWAARRRAGRAERLGGGPTRTDAVPRAQSDSSARRGRTPAGGSGRCAGRAAPCRGNNGREGGEGGQRGAQSSCAFKGLRELPAAREQHVKT